MNAKALDQKIKQIWEDYNGLGFTIMLMVLIWGFNQTMTQQELVKSIGVLTITINKNQDKAEERDKEFRKELKDIVKGQSEQHARILVLESKNN